MGLITEKDAEVKDFLASLENVLHLLEKRFGNCRPVLDGELFLTDRELSQRLHISRRTLQEYRTKGVLPYIQLSGKVLYRQSDVERLLRENYRKAFRQLV